MKPLEGSRVVELSTMLAASMTGRILAEWGADIIKVETLNGDAWRKQAGTTMSPRTKDANPNFDMQNLNKRFVSLNLRTPEGKEIMMKLLERADVLVTNYRIQALEGMGLSYEQLKDQFPRLIHAHVLGYGDKGPDKDRPGYDYTAFFSRSGLMADLPPAGAGPLVPIGGVGDHSVAVALAGGIFDRKDLEHAWELGADGVQIGTRFVTTWECDADDRYKQAYLDAKKEDIVIVDSPVGMPGRAIRNHFIETKDLEPEKITRCYQCISTCDPKNTPYCITRALTRAAEGDVDNALLFCGENAWRCGRMEHVSEIMEEMYPEAICK